MPGLLKKLQKTRPGEVAKEPVQDRKFSPVRGDEPVRERIVDTRDIDRRVVEAEVLLEDLVRESKGKPLIQAVAVDSEPLIAEVDSKDRRVVRRGSSGRKTSGSSSSLDESLPSWTRPDRRISPQAEALLAESTKLLVVELPKVALDETQVLVKRILEAARTKVSPDVRVTWKEEEVVERELHSLMFEKGPVSVLFEDVNVTDIHIDHHRSIKVQRKGIIIETPFSFRNADEYRIFLTATLKAGHRELGPLSPIIDCVVEDRWHSRVNALDSSVVNSDEPRVCIRVPRQRKFSFYDALQAKILPPTLGAWLAEIISQREANILVVGASNSGKTLMTAALASEVGSDERVVTIEDAPEIYSASTAFEKLVARPGARNGEGEVTLAMLVQAAIRRNPHRLILGELMGEETKHFLKALEIGYCGSIASIHADFPEDGLWRLLDLLSVYEKAPQFSLMRRITRSIHFVIGMQRVDEKPCVVEIAELQPLQGPEFSLLPLVQLENIVDGKRKWRITAENSYWMQHLADRGAPLRSGPGLLEFQGKNL